MDVGGAIAAAFSTKSDVDFEKLRQFALGVKDLVLGVVNEIDHITVALGETEECDQIQDPAIAFDIEQLKHALRELTILCKNLVRSAKNLAKYASNDKMHADISRELTANPPSTKALIVLLKGVKSQFKRCSQRAEEFVKNYEKLTKEIKEKSDEQSESISKQRADYESKELSGKSSRNKSIVTLLTGGVTVAASVATAAAPPLAVLIICAGTAAGTTYTAAVSANYYAAASFSKKYLKVLDNVAVAINKVHENVNQLKEQQRALEGYIEEAQFTIKSLEESASADEDKLVKEMANLQYYVQEMKDAMKEILDKCDNVKWDPK